ncbi:unnamed protein product, partial [Rotaria sp. Silwood1]
MFDKQTYSTKNLSTIHERQQKTKSSLSSHVLLKLPVTDDEKLQLRTTNIDNLTLENVKSIDEQMLKLNSSISNENQFQTDTLSYTPSLSQQFISSIERKNSILTFDQHRQLIMASAINYADSYENSLTSTHLNRLGSTRQYVSNIQRTLAVNAKPVLVKTTCNVLKHNSPITYDNNNNELFQSTRSLHSSTSLSSTGYDSNSSPSIISKRNSLITDRSNDHSLSNDEHQSIKPWILCESGIDTPVTIANSYSSDEIFDNTSLISHSNIKLNQSPSSTLEHRPISIIRHAAIRNSSRLDSPSISLSSASSSSSAKYIVQTTSFPVSTINDINKNPSIDFHETFSLRRKHKLNSTGFQIQQRLSINSPIVVQKLTNEREESPLPIVENPLFQQLPPRKPPRTFEHENRLNYISKTIDQNVPSSSSSTSDSPTFDLGARSISCMDLTAGVSSALLSSGLLPLDKDHTDMECKSNILFDNTKTILPNENIYEELKTPLATLDKNDAQQFLFNTNTNNTNNKRLSNDIIFHSSTTKTKVNHLLIHEKSAMKKGISEPNLAKTKSSSSTFFSPRSLIDRFKRILPLSLSKQSLNDTNTMTIDSDDSISISSENND